MKIRPATATDVPAVAHIVLSALGDEGPWKTYLPRKAQDDPIYTEYCEAILQSYLDPLRKDDCLFLVAESAWRDIRTNSPPAIVAAALWDTCSGLGQRSDGQRQPSIADRLHNSQSTLQKLLSHWSLAIFFPAMTAIDSHIVGDGKGSPSKAPGKLAALSGAIVDGKKQHFSNHMPYLFLHLLATKPQHQRKGYGKTLCARGIKLARQKQASTCAFAGSRGYILFSGMWFVDMGQVPFSNESGSEDILAKAMVLEFKQVQRRGSLFNSLVKYPMGRYWRNRHALLPCRYR